jgi:hypothetical protein
MIAGLTFRWAEAEGAMVPSEPTLGDACHGEPCGEAYPCVNALVYGVDVVLPIIDFGQDGAWRPSEASGLGALWIWARWAFIAIGWVLASGFVAAFTGSWVSQIVGHYLRNLALLRLMQDSP